ncbi:hypothetical protein ACA910_019007 [Epithemia clementina (nom. ined.)]
MSKTTTFSTPSLQVKSSHGQPLLHIRQRHILVFVCVISLIQAIYWNSHHVGYLANLSSLDAVYTSYDRQKKIKINPVEELSLASSSSPTPNTPAADGIGNKKNNERGRIAYVTYGHFTSGHEWRFQEYILDALDTWLSNNNSNVTLNYYFVLNREWKDKFEQACKNVSLTNATAGANYEHDLDIQQSLSNKSKSASCERVIPLYVDCPEGKFGASPCCKMDQGLLQMWRNHYDNYDWFYYADDDTYIRTAYLESFLDALATNHSPLEEPMVLTTQYSPALGRTYGRYQDKCSLEWDYRYSWGQPVIYAKAALNILSKGFEMNAMRKICDFWEVTHDVGNALLHWTYLLPEVRLPQIPSEDPPISYSTSHIWLGVHGFGVIKSRRRKHPIRKMKEIHGILKSFDSFPPPPDEFRWHRPKGFLQTEAYHLFGNATEWTEWHNMNKSDCLGPVHALGTPPIHRNA